MTFAILATVVGLVLLAWSADKFVLGSASAARVLGVPPLLIGMVVIGFGTSAPELVVSVFAATGGNPELALGNAYGSNIANIALILGVTAIITPVIVKRGILKKEIPLLGAITLLAAWQFRDGELSRIDALTLLVLFSSLLGWVIVQSLRTPSVTETGDSGIAADADAHLHVDHGVPELSRRRALEWTIIGLVVLVISSRLLVWGAVQIAETLGLSDLVIGLTVVAIGTSLPELFASVIAARKGQNDLALGNIIGSSLFNGLGVVGIAGLIAPAAVAPEIVSRDIFTLGMLVVALAAFGFRFGSDGRINRWEGAAFVLAFVAYSTYLVTTAI